MASETVDAPVIQNLPSNPGTEDNKPSSSGIPQENGDSTEVKPIVEDTTAEVKSSEDSKPVEESKPEEPKATDQAITPANGNSQEPGLNGKRDQPSAGDKRELEATSSAIPTDKPNAEEPVEPVPKKQKTSEEQIDATNGTSSPAAEENKKSDQPANGEKKRGGRPKKSTDTAVKKDVPTDGIGSRTRSRTKVVA